jgi:hypothetical protein
MNFDIDESSVLLRAIFQHYPELHEQQPAPDPRNFLEFASSQRRPDANTQ